MATNWENMDLEQIWKSLEIIILETAKETCGVTRINENRKQTRQWNKEMQSEIKTKNKIDCIENNLETSTDLRKWKLGTKQIVKKQITSGRDEMKSHAYGQDKK